MSVSILEALQGAEHNLIINARNPLAVSIGKSQLHNAVTLLEKGYPIETEVDPLIEQFGDVESVPDKK